MASKSSDVRPKITLACTECKERNYITKKNRRNDPDRLDLKKFCPRASGTRCTARLADPICWSDGSHCSGRWEPSSYAGGLLASRPWTWPT